MIEGKVKEETTCIIKFYSNTCHLCHNLQEYYEQISNDEKYANVHFFAFNIQDGLDLEQRLGLNGVPSIIKVTTTEETSPQIDVLGEPHTPNEFTYYNSSDIEHFLETEEKNE